MRKYIFVLLLFLLIGCSNPVIETRTFTGQLEQLDKGGETVFALYTSTGELLELESDLYDFESGRYDDRELEISGVLYDEDDERTFVVNSVQIIAEPEVSLVVDEINETDVEPETDESAEVEESDFENTEVEEDTDQEFEEVVEVSQEEEPSLPEELEDTEFIYDQDNYNYLESRPLGFRAVYPNQWYYAQVGNGYAFADSPVEDDSAGWSVYLALGELEEGLTLPDGFIAVEREIDGQKFVAWYPVDLEVYGQEILKSVDLLDN